MHHREGTEEGDSIKAAPAERACWDRPATRPEGQVSARATSFLQQKRAKSLIEQALERVPKKQNLHHKNKVFKIPVMRGLGKFALKTGAQEKER